MTREAVFETLNEVFRDVFDDESISVTEKTGIPWSILIF